MSTWDEEKLRSVVDRKAGGQGKRCETDIICKHFIEAIEKRQFGWAWECPNGGDKCQYRHALPDGYVLKRDKPAFEEADQGPVLEAVLEEKLNVRREASRPASPRARRPASPAASPARPSRWRSHRANAPHPSSGRGSSRPGMRSRPSRWTG